MAFSGLRPAVFLVLCVAARCQPIRITAGVVDDQVLQRNVENRAALRLSGIARGPDGSVVEGRILRKFAVVEGLDWRPVAKVADGSWSGEIRAIPTGGPYRIEVRVVNRPESAAVNNVLVGDLWFLAGQSNMRGLGFSGDAEQPHGLVHNLDMADHWQLAEEPIHRMGAGLGLPFAVEMVRRTGVPIGLVPCAIGATSMDVWSPQGPRQPPVFWVGGARVASVDMLPSRLRDGGDSIYGSMLRRFRLLGGRAAGMLWYQGESDTGPQTAPLFQQKFERLVAAVRRDFSQPDLPFYYVQIARHVGEADGTGWNQVQEMQRRSESNIGHCGMVAALDLSLDDGYGHLSTEGFRRLGRRMANLACRDLFATVGSCGQIKRGPRPVSATFRDTVVRVVYSDVNGRLSAPGRISGFSIHSANGDSLPLIYKATIDPADGNAVLLHIHGKLPPAPTLRYGDGTDPYCNLADDLDMAAPAFGPMAIQ